MSTYTQIYYHIIFSTKDRLPALETEKHRELFGYIWGIIKNKRCHLYRINGTSDHVHILSDLHPTVCLADLVKSVKLGASKWIKEKDIFPNFIGWQDGYGAFTLTIMERENVREYIRNQKEHHQNVSYLEELKNLLIEAGIEFDERYLR
jgi:REP element-mobilizing transposase RayT